MCTIWWKGANQGWRSTVYVSFFSHKRNANYGFGWKTKEGSYLKEYIQICDAFFLFSAFIEVHMNFIPKT